MPFRTYRYVIREADSRVGELFLAFWNCMWGSWCLISPSMPLPIGTDFLWLHIRPEHSHAWVGAAALILGVMEAWAVYYRYPRLRPVFAGMATVYWFVGAVLIGSFSTVMWVWWFAAGMLLLQAYMTFHKASTVP